MYILIGVLCFVVWCLLFIICANFIDAVELNKLFLTKYIGRFSKYTMSHIDVPGVKFVRFLFGCIYSLFFPIITLIDILIILIWKR